MTKTLVVSYTPRNGSYTRVLLNEFLEVVKGKTEIEELDLVETPPELLLEKNLNLIMEWNGGKRNFTDEETKIMKNHRSILSQLLAADKIVLAFPIYNFSLPAAVKAWVDAVVVSDETFTFNPETGFNGNCQDKRALIMMVSGFDYNESSTMQEYASSTIEQNMAFMGIESRFVKAFGVDQNREKLDSILQKGKEELRNVVRDWY